MFKLDVSNWICDSFGVPFLTDVFLLDILCTAADLCSFISVFGFAHCLCMNDLQI